MTVNNFRDNEAFPAGPTFVCFTIIATLKKEEEKKSLPLLSLLVLPLDPNRGTSGASSVIQVGYPTPGLSPSPCFSQSGFAPVHYLTHGTLHMIQGALALIPIRLY